MMRPASIGRLLSMAVIGLVVSVSVAAAGPRTTPAHFAGQTGPGSFYEIDVPAVWNGDLVLYAHGIVEPGKPLVPPTNQDGYDTLRAALLANGFAVAASSYASNGWSFRDALQRTHQLSGLFKSKVGQPTRTFLVGHSMGGLVVEKMAERYPGQYDGALAMCAPLGGAVAEIQYAGDFRNIFDFYFPGVLPGNAFYVPPGTSYLAPGEPGGPSPLFLQVYNALVTNPQNTFMWLLAADIPFNPAGLPASAIEAGLYVVGFQLRYTNDFVERVNGKTPYDNTETEYYVDVADPATNAYLSGLLNGGVQRFGGDQAAFNFYEQNYEPSGEISFPVVTLHGVFDPGVPIFHEPLFLQKVVEAGNTEWLLQRSSTSGSGHCSFTAQEMTTAFTDLVTWVSTGVKPE